jgi:hypothetical protein
VEPGQTATDEQSGVREVPLQWPPDPRAFEEHLAGVSGSPRLPQVECRIGLGEEITDGERRAPGIELALPSPHSRKGTGCPGRLRSAQTMTLTGASGVRRSVR